MPGVWPVCGTSVACACGLSMMCACGRSVAGVWPGWGSVWPVCGPRVYVDYAWLVHRLRGLVVASVACVWLMCGPSVASTWSVCGA